MSGIITIILLVLLLGFYLVLYSLLSIAKQADEIVSLDPNDLKYEKTSIASDSLNLSKEVENWESVN